MSSAAQADRLPSQSGVLVKEQLAARLKGQIMGGRLAPAQRVIEGRWAREFGVAQASVREAINLLVAEGFLVKDAGRSACVVSYTAQDVQRIYEVREALEGQAARLAALRRADLSAVDAALRSMIFAVEHSDIQALIHGDLDFHLALANASDNPMLADMIRRLLVPLFAFVFLRVVETGQAPESWTADLARHQRIIDLVREEDPEVACHYVQHCIRLFAESAERAWAHQSPAKRPRRT